MTPRANVGKGVTGAVRYVLGEGRDAKTGELKPAPADGQRRVDWISGTGFGFEIETEADADLARRVMEFEALNQKGACQQDCLHLSLAWRPGEKPTREQMEEAARGALDALGMGNAKALFVAHNDEDYAHVHIVASRINPETGYRYDLAKSWRTLSTWAEAYEREHGGIVSTRRETQNELRDAIARRDAGDVLEIMTKQRSTFTPAQLENALAKEIKDERERGRLSDAILNHADAVHLSETPGGPTMRYSSRSVLEAELYVIRAAEGLAARTGFQIDDKQRAAILNSEKFDGITREQARAFRHVTGAEGLAIIDGQAGTGKSYTLAATRQAYEAAGFRVIGLAPTNAVAQDMKGEGYGHAETIHRELFALNNGRTKWDGRTVVVVDEAAMLDTKLMAMVTAHAHDSGAKLILVGDDRQLSSIDRGGMFGALKDRHGAAELSEVKRQHKIDERRAAEMMAEGNFSDALGIYEQKGAIHWTRTQGEARAELVEQWAKDSAAKPEATRFVFAYTNDDVNQLNTALRDVRRQRGELGEDHEIGTAHGRQKFAAGDRIQFTGTDKKQGIYNGNAGTIEAIDGTHIAVRLDGKQPKTINFDAANFDQFRHGYAGTIYRGQGKTLDQTFLYHSEHWRSAASYVALTRHRDKAELFVARNTAKDINQLARQMGRTDDRRAASMFHHRQEIGPVRPLTAPEILARFAGKGFREAQKQQEERREARRSAGGGDMGYSHGDYASQSRAALREHTDRQRRAEQQQDKPQMDQEQDDEQKRKSSGGGIADDQNSAESQAANQNDRRMGEIEQPFERDTSFRPVEPEAGRYDELKPEPLTAAAIARDPWNAVALDLPANADHELLFRVAATSRELHSTLTERSGQADTPEQQELWLKLAEQATARQQEAESAIIARDATIRPEAATAEELTLDDIAERVQRLIDDPSRAAEENDPRILQALEDRREAGQTERPAEREAEEARRLAEEPTASEERQPESSAVKEAKEMDSAATSEEMTDSKQVQYSRWTGERLGPTTGPEQEQGRGQSQSAGQGRTR